MTRTRVLAGTVLAATALVLLPAPAATAHVHGINPLLCTPAPSNAGAFQVNETPAGPLTGVIPLTHGGNIPSFVGDLDAVVCALELTD